MTFRNFQLSLKTFLIRDRKKKAEFFGSDERFCKGKITIVVIAINVLILEQWRCKQILLKGLRFG